MIAALPLLFSLSTGAVSQAQVGVVAIGSGAGFGELVAACPRLLVARQPAGLVPLPSPVLASTLRTYASQCAGGTAIAELPPLTALAPAVFDPQTASAFGVADARTYWASARSYLPASSATDAQRLLGPSNFATNPDWRAPSTTPFAPAAFEYAASFWSELAALVAAEPGRPWSVVLPPSLASQVVSREGAFCDLARRTFAADAAFAWSWAARSAGPSTAPDAELETTLGYRRVRDSCGLTGVPVLVELTVAGGWGAHAGPVTAEWLTAVDRTVRADPEVLAMGGVALHAIGAGGVDDLAPAAATVAEFLAPGTGGGSSGGVGPFPDAGAGSGDPGPGSRGGCGNAGGGLALLGLAPFLLRRFRSRA